MYLGSEVNLSNIDEKIPMKQPRLTGGERTSGIDLVEKAVQV